MRWNITHMYKFYSSTLIYTKEKKRYQHETNERYDIKNKNVFKVN
jgi:hypothetical protein